MSETLLLILLCPGAQALALVIFFFSEWRSGRKLRRHR
jgi:hypothetical protein